MQFNARPPNGLTQDSLLRGPFVCGLVISAPWTSGNLCRGCSYKAQAGGRARGQAGCDATSAPRWRAPGAVSPGLWASAWPPSASSWPEPCGGTPRARRASARVLTPYERQHSCPAADGLCELGLGFGLRVPTPMARCHSWPPDRVGEGTKARSSRRGGRSARSDMSYFRDASWNQRGRPKKTKSNVALPNDSDELVSASMQRRIFSCSVAASFGSKARMPQSC